MFLVVSKWQAKPGTGDAWKEMSARMRDRLDAIDGVEFSHRFENEDGHLVVIIGYRDQGTYNALVNDPNGAVAKSMAEENVEDVGQWISSDRGSTIE